MNTVSTVLFATTLFFSVGVSPLLAEQTITQTKNKVIVELGNTRFSQSDKKAGVAYETLSYQKARMLYSLSNVYHEIPYLRHYSSFKVSVSSPINTYVKVRFDDTNLVLQKPKTKYEIQQGGTLTLTFTAYNTTTGYIEFLNEDDEVIHTETYTVKKASRSRNKFSISGGVQERHHDDNSMIAPALRLNFKRTTPSKTNPRNRNSWGFTVDNTSTGRDHFNPRATFNYSTEW